MGESIGYGTFHPNSQMLLQFCFKKRFWIKLGGQIFHNICPGPQGFSTEFDLYILSSKCLWNSAHQENMLTFLFMPKFMV